LLFTVAPASSEQLAPAVSGELTLLECINIALRNHPVLRGASEAVNASAARVGQAESAYYPQLSLDAGYSKYDSFQPNFDRRFKAEPYTAGINLSQNIYDFGRTSNRVCAAEGGLDASKQGYKLARQALVLRVKYAYFGYLRAKRVLAVSEETVRLREQVQTQATEFYKEGLRAQIDVTKAEANYFEARTSLIQARNALRIARTELENALAQAIPAEVALQDSLEKQGPSVALDEALKEAFARRPEWLEMLAAKRIAKADYQAAYSGYFPTLSGNAGYGYIENDFPPGEKDWLVGVKVSVPLFSGFLTREQVNEARHKLKGVDASEANLKLDLAKEVEQALLNLKESEERILSTRKAMEAAKENMQLAQARYAEGIGTIIEVTDAQVQEYNAETNYAQALYDLKTAEAVQDRVTGREY
jgi:TolC family type I secretion outer membrane protein